MSHDERTNRITDNSCAHVCGLMQFLLSEEEDLIVSELLGELFRRQTFNEERFYFRPPDECE